MTLETIAPLNDTPTFGLPAVATSRARPAPAKMVIKLSLLHHAKGHDWSKHSIVETVSAI